MLNKELLQKGYNLLDITETGDTTKSITFKQEEILVSYLEGMTLQEIGKEVGCTAECVRQHLVKVNRKVKHML